ncbi:hypothetical protein [Actinoplanes solisilvae]|uniref:hypothetical protein n=1 Tax=Actinoplanes solisilvae TaxID=2486853 RepID=UPI000FD8FAD7|nr:hypothetical protein [Actinoplanes solisilvae]
MDGSDLPPPSEDQEPPGDYDTRTYAGPAERPVTLPRISDYWPDATEAPPVDPPRPKRLRRLVAVAGAVLFLGVSAVVVARLAGGDEPGPQPEPTAEAGIVVVPTTNPPVSIAPAKPSPPPSTRPTSEAPAAPPGPAFAAGTFVLASNVTELNVSLGRPARNGVARVSTPKDGGVTPDADLDGSTLKLTAEPNGRDGDAQVDVVLDERITWTVKMEGGVRRGTFAMAGGRVRDFFFDGGAERLALTLPRQEREIDIRMAGGVHRWRIETEGEFPVKVRLRRGAGEVELNGDRDRDIDRGRTLRSRGEDEVSGGLEIEAVAGIGSLSVTPI